MKRNLVLLGVGLALAWTASAVQAGWTALATGETQPWWNIYARHYKCLTPEEERLQKFWHDYYDAMKNYYCALDHIDWVAYYKNHGYQINAGCGGCAPCGRVNYAPVFVTPSMTWAVPYGAMGGPPAPGMGAGVCGPAGCGPMGPMMPGPGY